MTQKYHHGDHVQVAADLGSTMSHFQSDCEAIIIGSYGDQFGDQYRNRDESNTSYTIHIKGRGQTSWYYESQLELIKPAQFVLLGLWQAKEAATREMQSDLDWIFSHGLEVLAAPHGATIEKLGKCLGITNMWGSRGEGIVWASNARMIMQMATPFLKDNNKETWLLCCDIVNTSVKRRKENPQ